MSHRYGIDSLAIRADRFFGWGWFLDDASPAVSIQLHVPMADGGTQVVPCAPGGIRTDLKQAFPEVVHAIGGGFLMQGRLEGPVAESEPTRLRAKLADGSVRDSEVAGFPRALAGGLAQETLQPWGAMPTRVWTEWRRHGARAAARWLRGQWRQWQGQRRTDALLAKIERHGAGLAVVIDHAMGGGANRYGEARVEMLRQQGLGVLLVRPRLESLQYQATLFSGDRREYALVDSLDRLLGTLLIARAVQWHVNNLVSFEDPLGMLDWLLQRRAHDVDSRLWFYLHDFHAACPSWTLIGLNGRFCGVPDLDTCRGCLPNNQSHTMSFPPHNVDIADWRASWRTFLEACDHLVAFSQASVDVLRLAHPGLDAQRIRIEPHAVDATGLREVELTLGDTLVIGVVGHINGPKGAEVIHQMAAMARERGWPVRFVVFGSLEGHAGEPDIEVLGEYRREHLPGLLESHGVSICLLPSVCVETFSYVTAELMIMNAPLAVFPIGAPAERVASYNRGLVLLAFETSEALLALRSFAERIHGHGLVGFN